MYEGPGFNGKLAGKYIFEILTYDCWFYNWGIQIYTVMYHSPHTEDEQHKQWTFCQEKIDLYCLV